MNIRKIFTLFLIFAAFSANAQITFNKANMNLSATATERLRAASLDAVNVPKRGTNMKWDYSFISDLRNSQSIDSFTYMVPVDTIFNATRYYIKTIVFGSYDFKSNIYFKNDLYGYGYVGYSVDNRQSYNIMLPTGGKTDSLIVPVQDSIYSAIDSIRPFIMKYPVNYNSNWAFSGNLSEHFLLDVPSLGSSTYVNLYGTYNVNRTVTDSVIGWGTLQVPYHYTTSVRVVPTRAYSVLLVKEDARNITSYAVNGLPPSAFSALLTGLSIKQNDTANTSTYIFYRAGYVNPLMAYEVDPSLGYDPDNTDTNLTTTGIETENAIINFEAYPNPVSQSNINFVFNKSDNTEWVMTITNEMGQVVKSILVNQPAGPVQMEINVPAKAANGIYFYNMADGGGSVAQGKFVLSR